MWSSWAFAASTRRHVHNLCVRRVLVRSASVQRGCRRGAPAIDEIHRSREEKARLEEGGGRRRREDVVCAARVRLVLGQYELCTARECKVHAEQTSRPNASEWAELRLSSSSSSTFHTAPCASFPPLPDACVHQVLKDTCARVQSTRAGGEHARELTSHEEVSFLSLPLFRLPLPLRRPSSFLVLSSCLILSFRISSLFFPYCALFQSLVVAVYYMRRDTHILFEPFA